MAIKEDIQSIKQELNAEEQFLENIIKSERFIKKYKKFLIFALAIGVVGFGWYYANSWIKEKNFNEANAAYAKLIMNPNDKSAKDELKSKDISLYALHEFKNALDNNQTSILQNLLNEPIDPILKDIIKAQIQGSDSQILKNYSYVLNGYALLKQDKIEEAKKEFAKVPLNSQLQQIIKNLQHYQGNQK